MSILSHIPSPLRNKFLLAGTGFFVWMLFFDNDNFFTQMERGRQLRQNREGIVYFTKQISDSRQFTDDLKLDPEKLEKYARERYKMKKDNEDQFLIQALKD
jgi:cell division protein FtsB